MLTKNDLCLLNEQYITVTREEDSFIELHSDSTGYCWTIFFNQFERSKKCTVYYKVDESEKAFHQYSLCHNASDAVRKIAQHDQEVFAKMKKREMHYKGAPEKATRRLKVHRSSGYNYKDTNTIILKGTWLEQWSFPMDSMINVVSEGDGKLSISVADE